MTNHELNELIKRANEQLQRMSPEDQAKHWEAQRQSFVRGMTTPCEHGILDFETCPHCRAAASEPSA